MQSSEINKLANVSTHQLKPSEPSAMDVGCSTDGEIVSQNI